jgi:ADP-ribose pyrophosphatase YjhB (NUDIX family)
VPDSAWASNDFLLGAGMVVIQETTEKILLVYETKEKYWFFPRGRKDMGETLEQAALREAYEEVCGEITRPCVFSS